MKKPIDNYWNLKLESLKENLEKNNFEVFIAQNAKDAKEIAVNDIIPGLDIKSVSWGGSMSFVSTGLFHELKDNPDIEVLNTFDTRISKEEMMDLRRRSLMTDLFITGTNAVTEAGHLVNLDMMGNRVAAIMWGPKNVLLVIGRNKVCGDLEDAMIRIKNYAAPVNTMNLDKKTPCSKTGVCHDCSSPDRICNYWTITEKSFVKKRIKIILVNEDLGF
ncbi:MAG: lactate utilization protein [Desulfobacula sp.]|jgi:L-lactate utilization protein LutB|uniref:lactate utilization protein n=1 Tax=Desulfobacula sp. TaxID=2593537 RepID=UPI001DBEEBC2|nr:lactate utilization protein [Desulfobacula sp.]MBT3485836.1 lactate utilization protein [Desulfobacula sp.]MBT3805717.1 lactate utilization protein [Desulfobacula sp.]MBT4025413.1 lactate utilization protein [Desulfobacula sp.]MBT4200049.1 lactate utilization protein [Desulfobacula sp.]